MGATGEWDRGQALLLSPEALLAAPSEKGQVSAGAEVCLWAPLWECNLWDAFDRLAVFCHLFSPCQARSPICQCAEYPQLFLPLAIAEAVVLPLMGGTVVHPWTKINCSITMAPG